jgi:outer membrane protein assembly factor BamB
MRPALRKALRKLGPMTGTLLRRLGWVGTPLLLTLIAGGLVPAAVRAQSCLCGTAADEFVAGRFGLEREWVVQVPFDSAASRLEHVVVGDALVVAQGGDGGVAAIAAKSAAGGPRRGTVVWSRGLGSSIAPIEAAGIGPELVTIARGRELVALDARTGETRWTRPLPAVASSSAVPSGGWVYAPLDAGGIERFPEDPWTKPVATEEPAAGDKPAAATTAPTTGPRPGESLDPRDISTDGEVDFPPLAFRGGILWCSADGRMSAIVPGDNASERLDFDLGSPAAGPPVVHDGDIFVATKAGDVARITRSPNGLSASSGVTLIKGEGDKDVRVPYTGWHTVLDEVPEGSPIVGRNTAVISLGPSGVAAFAADTGDLLWQEPAMGRPLAIIGDQVWCLEATGFLVARDLSTGARIGRLCLGCFTLPVMNTAGERLVLASPGGLVVSLAPRRTVAPQPPVPQPPVPQPPTQDQDAAEAR